MRVAGPCLSADLEMCTVPKAKIPRSAKSKGKQEKNVCHVQGRPRVVPWVHNRHLHLQIAMQTEKVFQKMGGGWLASLESKFPYRDACSALRVKGADLRTLCWCWQQVGALPQRCCIWPALGGTPGEGAGARDTASGTALRPPR